MTQQQTWYQNAVFYQVYVRAYQDSNGDGHGDLRGLMSRLDYIKELGVDCVWLMPIYPSPLKDDGYDIADYFGVLQEYGTLEDFRALVDAAHARELRIIADLVLNHNSDEHSNTVTERSNDISYVLLAAFLATSASAQDPRVEISGTAGWTFSDGVSGEARTVPGVGTFDRVDPKDAFSWGARIGFNATPNVEVGFLFNQQSTQYEARGRDRSRSVT